MAFRTPVISFAGTGLGVGANPGLIIDISIEIELCKMNIVKPA
jgi:hypothetical protein